MLGRNGINASDLDHLILHQANLEMMKTVVDNLGMPREKLLHNIVNYGNTAAAGASSVLADNWEKISAGQKVLITVVGSGLSWGSLILRRV